MPITVTLFVVARKFANSTFYSQELKRENKQKKKNKKRLIAHISMLYYALRYKI